MYGWENEVSTETVEGVSVMDGRMDAQITKTKRTVEVVADLRGGHAQLRGHRRPEHAVL